MRAHVFVQNLDINRRRLFLKQRPTTQKLQTHSAAAALFTELRSAVPDGQKVTLHCTFSVLLHEPMSSVHKLPAVKTGRQGEFGAGS
jgi:hypothetical protein